MTQKDKQLLLKDLYARLLDGVICKGVSLELHANKDEYMNWEVSGILTNIEDDYCILSRVRKCRLSTIKPYLRPMSSMTEEEEAFVYNGHIEFWKREEYCNKHYLDYRGLIPMGLAIEVTEENNPYKE